MVAPGWLDTPHGPVVLHLAHWDSKSARGRHDENTTTIRDPRRGQLAATDVEWRPHYDSAGQVHLVQFNCVMSDGSRRRFRIEPIGATASCLGPGLYNGYRGHYHGEDRGRLHIDGDVIHDIEQPDLQPQIHQLREKVARIVDEESGESGWGGLQIELVGTFPEYGLPNRDYR
ncbi:hypothetical protein [Nocardia vinacea]|uniref:hypothetical protein n=1 Tax=Nocardia vinacea TaxID=96468 RepID=UPI0012F68E2B|nr:hypothetical protein [Nocardia vinacea]